MRPLGSTAPWPGGAITERATAILAANPGWLTLDGTNSWLLVEPGAARAVLIDPGPDDPVHRNALVAAAAARGARIDLILLTHAHPDHAEGAPGLHALTGAPVLALDPGHRLGGEGLGDGDVLSVDGLELCVVATPGHTRDSLTFLLPADRALLTGDTVLGRGTAVIAHPDGHLGQYLASLDRLSRVAAQVDARWALPGHGPACPDPVSLLEDYQTHRRTRLGLVAAAVDAGITDHEALLDAAYPGLADELRPAALLSLVAQLAHLSEQAGDPAPD